MGEREPHLFCGNREKEGGRGGSAPPPGRRQPFDPLQRREVCGQLAVRPGHHRRATAEDGVAGQQRRLGGKQEADRVTGMPGVVTTVTSSPPTLTVSPSARSSCPRPDGADRRGGLGREVLGRLGVVLVVMRQQRQRDPSRAPRRSATPPRGAQGAVASVDDDRVGGPGFERTQVFVPSRVIGPGFGGEARSTRVRSPLPSATRRHPAIPRLYHSFLPSARWRVRGCRRGSSVARRPRPAGA